MENILKGFAGSVALAIGLIIAFGGLNFEPSNVSVGGSVPGVNLYPTTGEQQAITPTGDITLTHADSGKLYLIATGTTAVLPAAREGVWFRFMVSGAFSDTNFVASSTEGTNIEGSLIVAGLVVDCDNESQVNFIADGENLGDFVELYSDGTNWLIGASGGLTSAKITCTAT